MGQSSSRQQRKKMERELKRKQAKIIRETAKDAQDNNPVLSTREPGYSKGRNPCSGKGSESLSRYRENEVRRKKR